MTRWPRPLKGIAAILLALILALAALLAGAHAVITESSLRDRPVKAGSTTKVVLNFNSGIEPALSRVFLISKGDVQQPLAIRAGKKPGELLVDLPSLGPGEYALKCRVFAADGHLTEEIIRFRVSE